MPKFGVGGSAFGARAGVNVNSRGIGYGVGAGPVSATGGQDWRESDDDDDGAFRIIVYIVGGILLLGAAFMAVVLCLPILVWCFYYFTSGGELPAEKQAEAGVAQFRPARPSRNTLSRREQSILQPAWVTVGFIFCAIGLAVQLIGCAIWTAVAWDGPFFAFDNFGEIGEPYRSNWGLWSAACGTAMLAICAVMLGCTKWIAQSKARRLGSK